MPLCPVWMRGDDPPIRISGSSTSRTFDRNLEIPRNLQSIPSHGPRTHHDDAKELRQGAQAYIEEKGQHHRTPRELERFTEVEAGIDERR